MNNDFPDPRSPAIWGVIPRPPCGWTWEALMQLALDQADQAAKEGEIPIGAVLVGADGKILASEHNRTIQRYDPTAHAEILTLQAAGRWCANYRLNHSVLLVTLEPCLMCAGALVHARVSGLVYGAADNKAGAVESCLNVLELPFLNHHVWHLGGIYAEKCVKKLHSFFASLKTTL